MNKYSRNFILVGDLNYHCLLCNETYLAGEYLEKHLRWEKHRKSIKDLSPMPKFKRDRIYKIDDKYFCEHCNLIFSTVSEIPKHIQDENHQKRKAEPEMELRPSLCKIESGIIYIGKDKNMIKISSPEWYGIIDAQCSAKCIFCNVDVDHFMKHISLSDHVITMIQSKIVLNEEGLFYREFKDKYGYCFLCKTTFEIQAMSDHWKDEVHIEKAKKHNANNAKTYQKKELDLDCFLCKKPFEIQAMSDHWKDEVHIEKAKKHNANNAKTYQKKELDLAIVAMKLINTQKDYFDIDMVNRVATCKICTAYLNINFKFMVEHRKIHNITDKDKIKQAPVDMEKVFKSLRIKRSKSEIYDHGKLRAELAQFGRENFIKLVFPGDKGYCLLCGTYMSAHMKKFTEHLKGYIHMAQLDLKYGKLHVKPVYKTKNVKDFVETFGFSKDMHSLWINNQFFADVTSLALVSEIRDPQCEKFRCYTCDNTYKQKEYEEHSLSEMHRKNFYNAVVITTIEDEFIREVRPNLYHCAVCNLMFAFWDTLDKHIHSRKHNTIKTVMKDVREKLEIISFHQEELLPKLVSLGFKRAFEQPMQEK